MYIIVSGQTRQQGTSNTFFLKTLKIKQQKKNWENKNIEDDWWEINILKDWTKKKNKWIYICPLYWEQEVVYNGCVEFLIDGSFKILLFFILLVNKLTCWLKRCFLKPVNVRIIFFWSIYLKKIFCNVNCLVKLM